MTDLFDSIELHIRAEMLCSGEIEFLVRILRSQFVSHTALRADNKFLVICFCRVINYARRTSDIVGKRQNILFTFRMGGNKSIRVFFFYRLYIFRCNGYVYMAEAVVKDKVLFRHLLCDVSCEIFIGNEENILIRQ